MDFFFRKHLPRHALDGGVGSESFKVNSQPTKPLLSFWSRNRLERSVGEVIVGTNDVLKKRSSFEKASLGLAVCYEEVIVIEGRNFPALQQCIPLLFEILKFWNSADEGFVVNGHLLKFTSHELIKQKFLTGLLNRGDEIKWKIYLVLQNVTNEEVEQLGADLNALQNQKILPDDDVIFQSGNIVINRGDIDDILTNQYLADNHVDAFAFLLSEKRRIMPKEFQNYLYISPLYRAYRGYKQNFEMFIQHINPDSIRDIKLIVQPICFKGHWVLIIERLKDKIKQIHEDKTGVFSSDITTWKLQTVSEIPTQSNEYDCRIFICKYMEREPYFDRKRTGLL
ncbi:hypothetical protein IEQ34_021337 [Dendrobium chrysotoxum]|uniref:Ubiquitin-like protease family profile domain-containing protein n=1 Tax=Dendrobium chrysotoxum TaxID=161865 RepID=A0AAV7FLL6_DENCH|nr:hypothetical protein IEQ34_021337 [Dendrobium chrysotoxum]